MISKISLGSAQFGMDYGVANDNGKPTYLKVSNILNKARDLGIKNIDTASVYGKSESIIGRIGVSDFNVTTKIPSIPFKSVNVKNFIDDVITNSFENIKTKKFYGILLHDSEQLLNDEYRSELKNALINLKDKGVTEKIGLSIYDPNILNDITDLECYDIVQCPYNLFDRRLDSSGWMNRLNDLGIEIQIRSIFLQGLLLIKNEKRPLKFKKWNKLWMEWDSWLKKNQISPLEACINFSFKSDNVHSIVLGVDSESQLEEICDKINIKKELYPEDIFSNDADLINPVNWSKI